MNDSKTISLKQWAEDDRPREKLIRHGKTVLSDAELLAILIGSGNRHETAVDLCRRLLSEAGGNKLSSLAKCTVKELSKLNGIGEAKAISIIAALELAKRVHYSNEEEIICINSSARAYSHIRKYLEDLTHEEFYILHLNRANHLVGQSQISKGGIAGTVVDLRLVFKSAIERLSTSIVLCHNHPSGNLQPSEQDIKLTKKMVDAGKIMDIFVADHLIVTDRGYYSFADQGLI
jgi:DNA repair protein RadC